MTASRNGYHLLRIVGIVIVLAVIGGLAWVAASLEQGAEAAKPHIEGETAPLREILRFPAKDFPSIPDVERTELAKLVPLDDPIWIADVPPWTDLPRDPQLGVDDARKNQALGSVLRILRAIEERKKNPDETDTQFDERRELENAKEGLAAAEESADASQWLVSYNRGVVYRWLNNRQKAAKEFENAYKRLRPRLDATASDEALSAGIHALYGWGGSLVQSSGDGGAMNVPRDAIERLRDAVVWSATLIRKSRPQGVGHAAEFFDLRPSGLSTRAMRNDLVAAYLSAPDYTYCTEPFTLELCEQKQFSGRCRYRDETFCKTRQKASNTLSELYETELTKYAKGDTKEGTLWALQNVAELESENDLGEEPEVSYNVAYLLLRLKQPKLAYAFLAPVTENGDQKRVTEPMERLCFVTSILSGAKPTAISSSQGGGSRTPSEFRVAYDKLYTKDDQPPPFEPLPLGDEQKAKSLDAWLFIRRYRHLLEEGQFETFIAEHRNVMAMNVPKDFLGAWKQAVVVEFLQRAAAARTQARPETAAMIDRFLSRSDLFTSEELKVAKLSRPWSWWKLRWLYHLLAITIGIGLIVAYVWLCVAYRSTFVSAYQRERRGSARMRGTSAK
jgi:tetratricopeptide (TPR) repeat protein